MRRRRVVDRPRSHERWLVSYADFITLLFALFTVLYASSTVDARKLSTMVQAMQLVFSGEEPTSERLTIAPELATPPVKIDGNRLIAERLRTDFAAEIANGRVAVDIDGRGVVVSIRETGSFVTGSAELPQAAADIVHRLASVLADAPNAIKIEGHTDDVPIETRAYRSNWELSTARATRVIAEFIAAGIPASRLSAGGYAEFHPRVPNDSPENRARNRRVDIVILNAATTLAEEPSSR